MSNLSDIFDLLRSMGLILAIAFYVSIVIWAYKDARKRIDDPILVATLTAVAMLPLFGVFIYMLVRPSEYLADVRERELEIRMMERELGRHERCPYCKSHIDGDYLSCPVCTTKLRQSCVGCTKPLDPRWVMCPFCETEVPGRGRPTPPSGGASERGARPAPRAAGSTTTERPARPRRERGPKGGTAGAGKVTKTTAEPNGTRPQPKATKTTKAKADGLDVEPLGPDTNRTQRQDTTLI